MLNPFEDSQQVSIDQFDSSLPICFGDQQDFNIIKSKGSQLSSPIAIIDIDKLSEKFSNTQINESELKNNLRQAQQMLRQLKTYTQQLQQRSLQMATQLEREKIKNKQLLNTLNFLKNSEQERNQALQQKLSSRNQLSNKYVLQKNRNQILDSETKTLKLQNNYLKELILIANQNYQKLEQRNRQLLQKYNDMEEEKSKRQVEMLKKTQEIKSMFTAIVIENNQNQRAQKELAPRKDQQKNIQNTINFNSVKSVRKEPVEDAYRQIFMKTLKIKKENRYQ